MTAKRKNIKKGTTPETKKDLVRIDALVQECLDNFAERHHYKVPNDGDFGFGGTCFPKDINALIISMKAEGIDPLILEAVWEQNINMRKNWDWAEHTSAVLLK